MEPLIADRRARKLSFTGSTEVGRALLAQAATNVLRVSMELGGNAPFLVFEDADLDAAVAGAMVAKMRNVGEACTAANRFLVAEPVAAPFSESLAEAMGALRVGRGTDENIQVGPLIDENQRAKVATLVDDAVGRGARVLVGGGPADGADYFYAPTVLADVPRGRRRTLRLVQDPHCRPGQRPPGDRRALPQHPRHRGTSRTRQSDPDPRLRRQVGPPSRPGGRLQ